MGFKKIKDLFNEDGVLPMPTPAEALQAVRLREDLTQAELAIKLGVEESEISEMEIGTRPIGEQMARRLGEILGLDYMFF